MPDVIDCSSITTTRLDCLQSNGVKTIIRYYARDTGNPSKVVRRAEASAIADQGLRLAVVHEGRLGDKIAGFDQNIGLADARHSRFYAHDEINQPENTAIYFAVDFDASASQITNNIIPYFQSVATAFGETNGLPTFRVGVYGSGRTCKAMLDAGLAEFAWLAQSTGWAGHDAFLNSGRWVMNQKLSTTLCGIGIDPNILNPSNPEIGDFVPVEPQPTGSGNMMVVNASDGLRMRAGPGTDFDIVRVLAFGTRVTVGATSGDWIMVDLDGDGAFDGFVHRAFLIPA